MNSKSFPDSWSRFKQYAIFNKELGFSMDISRMNFSPDFMSAMEPRMRSAFERMDALERGEISNPDEKRMVGHYWLRSPGRAANKEIGDEIRTTLSNIESFSTAIHTGKIRGEKGENFKFVLSIGIGGSALGPQFVSNALTGRNRKMDAFFIDNTDPDGIYRTLGRIPDLSRTLTIVISKSGGTKETRNGMVEVAELYRRAGLSFAKHAVAVTGDGSELDQFATKNGWLKKFPMWDWVGGRTSELSAVGLLPAALEGFDIQKMLQGAEHMDEITRKQSTLENPAALMALMWHHAGKGQGLKDMVILPYKDRLELFSRYLQQLVMESLGKEKDLNGKVVNQGIAVYGNKGSTDQHAYVQQLRDGINNFFAIFIEVLEDLTEKRPEPFWVEPDVTSGDYLNGFYQGTRLALHQGGRESISITVRRVDEFSIGMLIALFERAVGLYASLVNINAYHQPGVESGKKAAAEVLKLQHAILKFLKNGKACTAEEVALGIDAASQVETVYLTLRHLAANDRVRAAEGSGAFESVFSA